jgi:hypothetical protein
MLYSINKVKTAYHSGGGSVVLKNIFKRFIHILECDFKSLTLNYKIIIITYTNLISISHQY